MTKQQLINLENFINLFIKKTEEEALMEGVDIFSDDYALLISKLKEKILEEIGLTAEQYTELTEALHTKQPSSYRALVDTPEIPTEEQIRKIAERELANFKPVIPAPQITNQIVKETIVEKPITKIIREKEVVRELDKTETENLKKNILALQESFTELYDKMGKVKMPDDYVSTSVLEPSVKELLAPELNRILRSFQSQVYAANKRIDGFYTKDEINALFQKILTYDIDLRALLATE